MIERIFINREKEKMFFLQDLSIQRDSSRVILIHSSTGIGKSSLVDKVMFEMIPKYNLKHRVKIKQNESEECDYGFFIKKIVKLLDINSLNSDSLFVRFNEFIQGKMITELFGEAVVKKILSPVGFDDYLNQRKNTDQRIQEWLGNELDFLLLGKEYIKYVLKKRKIVLAIENIQNIDDYSMSTLLEIVEATNNFYLFFEYTTGGKFKFSISEIHSAFSPVSKLCTYSLSKLEKEVIIENISDDKEFVMGVLKSYDKSDGNLFKLSVLLNDARFLKSNKNLEFNEVIRMCINGLDNQLKILLLIIESHKNGINKSTLNCFIITYLADIFDIKEFNTGLNYLQEQKLIICASDKVLKVTHDSLFKELNLIDELKKYYIIILRKLCDFYKEKNEEKLNHEERLNNYLLLISFLLRLNSYSEIIGILKYINYDLVYFPINSVINYVDLIRRTYNENKLDNELDAEIEKWLTYIYFRCGFYKQIVQQLSYSKITDVQVKLCYLAALSSEKPKDALHLIEENQKVNTLDKLELKLIKMRALRSSRRIHECYNLWIDSYQKECFKDTLWEGDFFRYSCLCIHDNIEFRIKCIKKAFKLFQKQRNYYGIVASCITLMRDYSFIKDYKKSKKWIEKAEHYTKKTVFPMYMYYNNRAVQKMLIREIKGIILFDLYRALDMCKITDDETSIQSNILCYYIIIKDYEKGIIFYNLLVNKLYAGYHSNSLIAQAVVYNCYKYANKIKDITNLVFLTKCYNELERFYKVGNTLASTHNYEQVPSIVQEDYYPILMVNWDVDYYSVLNNY